MRVFISGAKSIIGQAVVSSLIARNHSVTALVSSLKEAESFQDMEITVKCFSIEEPGNWIQDAVAHDAVIHLVSAYTSSRREIDMRIIQGVSKYVQKRESPLCFVYTGGCWLFPSAAESAPITETTMFEPPKNFKWVPNHIRSLQFNKSISLTVVHPAHICSKDYGIVQQIVAATKEGKTFKTSAKATTHWPLVEISDLAELYCLAVEAAKFRLIVNACGNPGVAVGELSAAVSAYMGNELKISTGDASDSAPELQNGQLISDYNKNQHMSSNQARQILRWRPKFENIEDFIRLAS